MNVLDPIKRTVVRRVVRMLVGIVVYAAIAWVSPAHAQSDPRYCPSANDAINRPCIRSDAYAYVVELVERLNRDTPSYINYDFTLGTGDGDPRVGSYYIRRNGQWQIRAYFRHCQADQPWNPETNTCGNPCANRPDATNPAIVAEDCPVPPAAPFDPGKNNQCDLSTGPTQVGNPVNMFVGHKLETAVDFVDPAGRLTLSRHYSSLDVPDNRGDVLGGRWRHGFQIALVEAPAAGGSGRRLNRPDGSSYLFVDQGGGLWAPDADVRHRLFALEDSGTQHGWLVVAPDETREEFDLSGRLARIRYLDGDVLSFAYDSAGLLSQVEDSRGRRLAFTHDEDDWLVSVALPDGGLVTYGHAANRLEAVSWQVGTAPALSTRSYLYEDAQDGLLLTGIVDESGQRYATWQYDSDGRVVSSRHGGPDSEVDLVSIAYGSDGSQVTNPLGQVTTYGYTMAFGRAKLASADQSCGTCTAGEVSARTYDGNGFPDLHTDFSGVVTDYDYDANGLLLQRVEGVGTATERTVQSDWHATFNLPVVRRTYAAADLVATWTWTYNDRGQPLTWTRIDPATAATRTRTMTYCEAADVGNGLCPLPGLLVSVDGPRSDVADATTYTYYPGDATGCAASPTTCLHRKGDLWKVTNALGQVSETLRYDGAGRPLSIQDANGTVTDLEYHPRGWLTARKVRGSDAGTETDDRITRIDYWPTGLVQRVTQPDGAYTAYDYDAAQRLTSIRDNAGNTIAYTLDNAGNRVAEETRDSSGTLRQTLSRVFDQLGQLATQADASDNPTDFGYDPNGNLLTVTDPLGRRTAHAYDPLNRLKSTLQDVGGIAADTQFEYDALDNLTKVVDPKGLETNYTYNAFGDLLSLDSPDTGTSTYTYDSAGNRIGQIDARGQASSYAYDALDRVTGIVYAGAPDLDIAYGYDTVQPDCTAGETFAIGRLTAMNDASGSTQYCYDRFGELVRKVQVTIGQTFVLRYGHTQAGQLRQLTYPDGSVADYVRDVQGRVTEVGVTSPGGTREVLLTGASYYPFGPSAGWTYGNGRTLSRTHDLDYRPESILDTATGGLDLGYSYDPVGHLTQLRTADLAEPPRAHFDYDPLGRLIAFRDGAAQTPIEQYAYDATGNRTSFANAGGSQAYSYPADSHRLASVAGVPRAYDAVGNTLTDGTAKAFIYNAANRLGSVAQGGSATRHYAYNGRGERVRSHLGPDDITTVYDEAGRWLGDYDVAGTPLQQAIWLDDAPVGLLVGNATTPDRLHYVQPDHLGTPRAVIHPARNVAVWRWDLASEAFGNSPPHQDPDNDGVAFVFDMRFPGQRYDAASGLNYNYFRDYEPGTGRYAQSDPIGLGGGISTYAYVMSHPINAIDSLGLQTCLLTTVGPGGVRDHSAVYTARGDGSGGPALYDPAGSYGAANNGGSSGILTGEAADIGKFKRFHKSQTVESTCKATSQKEEESIIGNAMDLPSAAPFQCAVMASSALSGQPSFPHVQAGTFWPGNLLRQVRKVP